MPDRRDGWNPPPMRNDGLPTAPDGSPLLQRWFVLTMIPLVLVGLVVIVLAVRSAFRPLLSPAERRPPGDAVQTHDAGDREIVEDVDAEAATGCAEGATIEGDDGARAAARRALSGACQLLAAPDMQLANQGLDAWLAADEPVLRFAIFARNGLDSTVLVAGGRVVIELNNKFIFDDATEAAPTLLHELAHLGQGWPKDAITAHDELAALEVQQAACDRIAVRQDPPRTCLDADQFFELDDPLRELLDAGWPR